MSLHYRGVTYDPAAASVKSVASPETTGHYRGAVWNIHPSRAVQPKRSGLHLKYRGASIDAD